MAEENPTTLREPFMICWVTKTAKMGEMNPQEDTVTKSKSIKYFIMSFIIMAV